jgi:multiple sugar transport system substrate-binding protein
MKVDAWERARLPLLAVVVLVLMIAACDNEEGEDTSTIVAGADTTTTAAVETTIATADDTAPTAAPESRRISFWSAETQPERLKATQAIIDAFTEETGITVQLVPVDENALSQVMPANANAGTLPDVIFHPLDFTVGWANAGILDIAAAGEVIDNLGADTFSQAALALGSVDGVPAAVPSDGWGQLLIYRKDLFDEADLGKPDTFDKVLTAAEELNDPGSVLFGITASNDPTVVFTQQTWEHFALANGCNLVDASGRVTLDTPNCVEAINFYTNLLNNYSPPGMQNAVSTRATYFAGQAAMIVWPSFIMDEMAGLRYAAFPTCARCLDNIAFLAENSDFVTALSGPSGAPTQYGQVSYLGIGVTDNTEASKQFVEFWLSEGYLGWLSTSPEGRFPMRRGTQEDPTAFVEGWWTLTTGVDEQAPLSDFYAEEVMNELIEGSNNFARWGFIEGQGELVSAVYATLIVPRTIDQVLAGSLSAEEGAQQMQELVENEQSLLE